MSTAVQIPAPTAMQELDHVVARLKESSQAFARLPIAQRIELAEQLREGYHAVARESVVAACKAKGIDPNGPLAGEEWLAGPMVTLRNLRLLVQSLREIQSEGTPHLERSWMKTLPDGRLAIKVFPTNSLDAMLLAKHEAWVHMEPGITADNIREHQASFYKKPHNGKLCVVLGAGNVNSIPPTDVLYKMFVEGTVCILKMNPVNAYVGPFVERAFKPAMDRGFFAVVYCGAEEGGYLVNHPQVDEVHITGSDKTHDAMVWGPPGPEREARKRRKEPLLKKEISSELGNVSAVIVIPGPYGESELGYQADNVAGMVTNNASFNCNSAKLMISAAGWAGRDKLKRSLADALAKVPVRKAYYPGAEQRWNELVGSHPTVKRIGEAVPGTLQWAMIEDIDAGSDDKVFSME
ncbi:MAG TPA: aldehyde dehydrogenase, partial [Myxococcaceae bacterium]|nr:aldehyde dehydrogenase [Myxococcaceae bacterium]